MRSGYDFRFWDGLNLSWDLGICGWYRFEIGFEVWVYVCVYVWVWVGIILEFGNWE